ncbi:polysaccharide biosynthesis/export family protein [Sphingomonas sp. PB2P19]|uniref:polysaccharide biosynthesis/export family protein n=1 Tax=Sphingomonas rhamnosi TaxID=3096156 RepID=UPI002FCC2F02
MPARLASRIVWACVAIGLAASPAAGQDAQREGATQSIAASSTLPTYAYALSGGDRVRVVVFGDPALGGEFTIDGSGFIALPLIGNVDVRGLTSAQLQSRIVTRLADGYLQDPRVAVEVLSTRPFYILGEVNKPGQYPFANGLTVEAAVAQAGGYTYRAKTNKVLIKHAGKDEEATYDITAATMIAPGDTIRIRERWF